MSLPIHIMEIQIKNTLKFHLIPVKMIETTEKKYCSGCGEKWLSFTYGGLEI